ncbi:septal ring lytic transglycosylase RlpA family protein [Verrucomicrobiota bacterium sgz303538]
MLPLSCQFAILVASAMLGLRPCALAATADKDRALTELVAELPPVIEVPKSTDASQTGIASWYGGGFVGGRTASGERYRADERTAAHRTLPFGTYVRVVNLKNNKSAVVRINNRGPFRKNRIIDLSRQAALDLAMVKSGIARVRLEILSKEVAAAAVESNK